MKGMKTLYSEIVVVGCSTPLYADDEFGSAIVESLQGFELVTKLTKEKIDKSRKTFEERKLSASTRRCGTPTPKTHLFSSSKLFALSTLNTETEPPRESTNRI